MIRLAQALVVATLVEVSGTAVAGQEPPVSTLPHVRAMDSLAAEVLETAVRLSPTVAQLVSELQSSDVIVTVACGKVREGFNGLARVVSAAGGFRHVRVVLRIPNSRVGLMEVLGHELRHCVEIAGMPEVRDQATMKTAYERVGVAKAGGGYFETDAAVRTGALVAREVGR